MIGTFGRAEVFSFHATKFLNSFEGGAIVTDDDQLADKIRLMQNFGFQGYDNVVYIGTNGKMTEVCAAMGLTNFASRDEFMAQNLANYRAYRARLARMPGFAMLKYEESERRNYQYVVVEVDPVVAGISRDELVKVLHAENVIARRYFYPGVHRMEPYRSRPQSVVPRLPATEEVCAKVLVLPTGLAVDIADINRICDLVEEAVRVAPVIRQVLEGQAR
jgi:dTDP-4-amino-4,6-dideoxygalactose transaminase